MTAKKGGGETVTISKPSAKLARKYGKNVSRGIIEMGRCIEVLEKANKEKLTVLQGTDLKVTANYLCKNRPELIREIFCEDCIEHTGVVKE